MKSVVISFFALFLICASCEKRAVVEHAIADTLSASLPIGVYSGTIPCGDCKGIAFDVELDSGFQYISKQQYLGKSEKIITKKGEWIMLSDTMIKLESAKRGEDIYFSIKKNALRMLDKEGNWFVTDMESRYTLRKQSTADTIKMSKVLLSGKWELTECKSEKVQASDYTSGVPHIEFKSDVASGFSGCNRFTGSYTTGDKSSVTFGMMATTRMACTSMDKESIFLEALENTAFYKKTASTLTLFDSSGKALAVFNSK
ncbi:MAG: META domain-containing protein [Cytophagales bacterium]|nr:META domain-containing protein [Cytophaga sp.]